MKPNPRSLLGFSSVKPTLALSLAMALAATTADAATIVSTPAGGNWDAPATWVGGVVPSSSDDAQIFAGATVSVVNNAAANSVSFLGSKTNTTTLSVSSGMTLNVTGAITEQNATTNNVAAAVSGAGTINCASLNVAGVAIPTLGHLTTVLTSTIGQLNIAGDLTIAAYDGGGSSQDQPAFYLSSGAVNVGGTLAMTETGAVNGPAGTQTFSMATGAQSGTLTLSGTPAFSLSANVNINLNGANSTVVYAGGTQTILSTAYNNLTLKNPGTKSFTGPAPTISDALEIDNDAIFNMPSKMSATSLYLDGERQAGNGQTYGGPGSGADHILDGYFSGTAKFKAVATTIGTTMALTRSSGPTNSVYGTALSFHALVSVVGGGTVPNGDTVTFSAGSTIVGTATTSGNTADVTIYNVPVGSIQTITATYNGDTTYVASTSSGISQTVTPKSLFVQGLSAANKFYDGTAIATLSGTAALLSSEALGGSTTDGHPYNGDAVSLSSSAAAAFAGTFSNTNGGVGVVVTITGNSLSGAQAVNYALASPDEANGTVTANVYLTAGTNTIGGISYGATTVINATGNAFNHYVLERSTSLPNGAWTVISTNTADASGSMSVADTFSDLGGAIPPQAFYRFRWQP